MFNTSTWMSCAKWLDKKTFGENKIFLKERKNGELTTCHRGHFWSFLSYMIGRKENYDLWQLFGLTKTDSYHFNFRLVARTFFRCSDASVIKIALEILNLNQKKDVRQKFQSVFIEFNKANIDLNKFKRSYEYFIPTNIRNEAQDTELKHSFYTFINQWIRLHQGFNQKNLSEPLDTLIDFLEAIYPIGSEEDPHSYDKNKILIATEILDTLKYMGNDINLKNLSTNIILLKEDKLWSGQEIISCIKKMHTNYSNNIFHQSILQENFIIFCDSDTLDEKIQFIRDCPLFSTPFIKDVLLNLRVNNIKLGNKVHVLPNKNFNDNVFFLDKSPIISLINEYMESSTLWEKFTLFNNLCQLQVKIDYSLLEPFFLFFKTYNFTSKMHLQLIQMGCLLALRKCKKPSSIIYLLENLEKIIVYAEKFDARALSAPMNSVFEFEINEKGHVYSNLLTCYVNDQFTKPNSFNYISGIATTLESSPSGTDVIKSLLSSHFFEDYYIKAFTSYVQENHLKKEAKYAVGRPLLDHHIEQKFKKAQQECKLIRRLAKIPATWQGLISPLINRISTIHDFSTTFKSLVKAGALVFREAMDFEEATLNDKIKTLFLTLHHAAVLQPRGITSTLSNDIVIKILSNFIMLRYKDSLQP